MIWPEGLANCPVIASLPSEPVNGLGEVAAKREAPAQGDCDERKGRRSRAGGDTDSVMRPPTRALSRRKFLKQAGGTLATVTAGASVSSLLEGCGQRPQPSHGPGVNVPSVSDARGTLKVWGVASGVLVSLFVGAAAGALL